MQIPNSWNISIDIKLNKEFTYDPRNICFGPTISAIAREKLTKEVNHNCTIVSFL
jgi:hypothetical protein